MRRNVLYALLLVGSLIAITIAVSLLLPAGRSVSVRVPPNPNGYDTLVRAATMIVGSGSDYREMSPDDLRQFVSDNTDAFALARVGLQQESMVTLQPTMSYMSNHISELAGWKRLAQALAAESRLAGIEGRWTNAADAALDIVRLGPSVSDGGVNIDLLVGIAVEQIGISELRATHAYLDAAGCRSVARVVEHGDADRPAWETVMDQELAWSRETYTGLGYRLSRLVMSKSMKAAEEKSRQRFQDSQRKTRDAMLLFAARAYELEKGSRPSTPRDLVPEYLKSAPTDPKSGTELPF
jgi:hypothetical protein